MNGYWSGFSLSQLNGHEGGEVRGGRGGGEKEGGGEGGAGGGDHEWAWSRGQINYN